MHIAVVGSLNVDSVVRMSRFPAPGETVHGQSHQLFPGGKGGNQAHACARLVAEGGPGVHMIGQVGGDGHGAWLKESLERGGVNVEAVSQDGDGDVSSGIAIISLDETGQNHIVIVPGANGTFSPERLQPSAAVLASASATLLQLEVPLETVEAAARLAKAGSGLLIVDPAPAQELPPELVAACDYLTPNESELRVLCGEQANGSPLSQQDAAVGARALLDRGAGAVVVKMGGAGALCVKDNQQWFWPAPKVDVVDTTAAGDTWNAAFATALVQGAPIEQAGAFAVASAALSVTRPGAQPSVPSCAEVETFLQTL